MGHKLAYLVLTALVMLLSTCRQPAVNRKDMDNNNNTEPVGYLALGDSYTIGEDVAEQERWPAQLADSLEKTTGREVGLTIIAKTGWTSDELMDGIKEDHPEGTYDMVSLLIGVNNQYRGRDTAEYRKEFRELLGLATGFAGDDPRKVLVLSIPDWGVTPFAEGRDREKIAKEIDIFNTIKKEESLSAGARYCDFTPITRDIGEDNRLLAPDGLHPSGKMYSLWVKSVFPTVLGILNNTKENE